MNSRLKSAYARITRTIEAGTASIVDVAWVAIRGNLDDLTGRPLGTERVNSLARGVLGVAIGVVILVWPDPSLAAMVVIVGVYAIADGVLSLVVALTRSARRWQFVGQGVTSLAVGALVLLLPEITSMALLYLLAVWVVVMSALRLRGAITFGERVSVRWVPAILSLLGILAGARVLIVPGAGMSALSLNLAIFAVLSGVALIEYGLRETRVLNPDWSETPRAMAR
jgi:uncharacterized membrane protein HdeD (DUF308 family)